MASAVVLLLTASCLNNDDPYNAGFFFSRPTNRVTTLYANNVNDSLSFFSYGKWNVTRSATGNMDWLQLNLSKGNGNTYYTLPVTFEQNTTGSGRGVQLNFIDSEHPDDARATLLYWQFATRGDGALGSAADVKAIHGSDSSLIELAYDEQHRPTLLRMTGPDATGSRQLTLAYNDRDSIITVTDNMKVLTSVYGKDYQPQRLIGGGDTIGYYSQYYTNGIPVSATNAFNVEHHTLNGQNTYYAFLLNGQSLQPDSLHCADSLRIATANAEGAVVSKLKLAYSKTDNRCQSVDVNQLVFGVQQCDPYQLLSLFRYARQTSILSETSDEKGNGCVVEVSLNSDRSVSSMTVKQKSGGMVLPDIPLEYTFDY